MRNVLMLLASASLASLISTSTFAAIDAEALIKQCQQQSQGAGDMNAAVNKCLDEKHQYDTSSSGDE